MVTLHIPADSNIGGNPHTYIPQPIDAYSGYKAASIVPFWVWRRLILHSNFVTGIKYVFNMKHIISIILSSVTTLTGLAQAITGKVLGEKNLLLIMPM